MIQINFLSDALNYRRKFGGGKNQAIAKACGTHKGYTSLIDATAGLGEDGFILASLGFQIILIERHPEIYAALSQALSQASEKILDLQHTDPQEASQLLDILSRIKIYGEDAKTLIPTLPPAEVILLDPMFPEREKSALVKKPMRELKSLIGGDSDADELLPIALKHATKRVVVKRPKRAPFLNHQKPDFQLLGKSSRFDVYLAEL